MSYDQLTSKFVNGRKKYVCEWCGQYIEKGSPQHYRSYVFHGDFITGRTHIECWLAMEKSSNRELADGWTPGDFKRGEIIETYDDLLRHG